MFNFPRKEKKRTIYAYIYIRRKMKKKDYISIKTSSTYPPILKSSSGISPFHLKTSSGNNGGGHLCVCILATEEQTKKDDLIHYIETIFKKYTKKI